MNSGVLDLKTRRKVNLGPADAGVGAVNSRATGEEKASERGKMEGVHASESRQVKRKERIREVLIVSIRCVKKVVALRSARELQPRVPREISRRRATWRQEGHNAGALAPPANDTSR